MIRQAKNKDLKRIIKICNENQKLLLDDFVESYLKNTYVYCIDDIPIGYITVFDAIEKKSGIDKCELDITISDLSEWKIIWHIAIIKKYQRHVIGTKLINFINEQYRKNLFLDVVVSPIYNQNAINFYLKNEFQEAGYYNKEWNNIPNYKSKIFIKYFGEIDGEI